MLYLIGRVAKFLRMSGVKGLLKSIYWNFRLLPFKQAIKIPIILGSSCTLRSCKRGCIQFKCERIRPGILIIGTEYYGFPPKGGTMVRCEGKMIIKGFDTHWFGSNGYLTISKNGCLEIDDNFHIGNGWCIYVSSNSKIGANCMFSWNILLLDTDCHPITDKSNRLLNPPRGFTISDNVWIGAYSSILKGAQIPFGSIIATGSIITAELSSKNSIYVGNKAVREDIYWSPKPL